MNKNETISKSLKTTREKRAGQECRGFEIKIDESHLSNQTKQDLVRLFLECKWLYNHTLSEENIFSSDDKIKTVLVKVGDEFEERELRIMRSQIKQSVLDGIKQNVYSLSKAKAAGLEVGRLKFISRYTSIELKQHGKTYSIKGNRIKIQGIKQKMRVRGLDQIAGYERANAKLVQRPSGYYLLITCYREKIQTRYFNPENKDKKVGIDFGILNQLTLSNGLEIKYQVPVATQQMRKLQKKVSKKELRKNKETKHKKNGANYFKAKNKLQKQHEIYNNRKKDTKNKIVNILHTEYGTIAYQNDAMQGWQRLWGARMLNTAIGGITTKLKQLPTSIEVDRFFASTKQCPICEHKNVKKCDGNHKKRFSNLSDLSNREFECDNCGYTKPRDWKSASMILDEALKNKIGAEYTEYTPVESESSTLNVLARLNAIPTVKASLLAETGRHYHL